MSTIDLDDQHDDIMYPSVIPFALIHLGCAAAFWTGITWQAVAIGVAIYWLRMFAITAGYHRYFSHRSYSTGRLFQFILAVARSKQRPKEHSVVGGQAQTPSFAFRHPRDVHSPRHKGFVYSHVGWIFARRHDATDLVKVADFASFPELRWLHKFEVLPAIALAALCFLVGGWSGLVVGFLWSTVVLYHATFCINSLAHVHGRKRYVTGDDFAQQLAAGAGYDGRGLAQQSSRLPKQRPPGLSLVGN